jgi:hypothetical protein
MMPIVWITLLAYEARIRHAADDRLRKEAARRLASVRSRVLAELRCAIASGIEGFLQADQGHPVELTCQNGHSAQSFVVSRTDDRLASRRLAVDLEAGTLICRYDLPGGGGVSREVLAIDIAVGTAALSLWDEGVERPFTTVETLSTLLLAPILRA